MDYRILLKKTTAKKIYVDPQEEEGFYLYPGEVRKAGLTEGMTITEDHFTAIRDTYAVPRAKKRALGLLSKKDLTQQELKDKLVSSLNDEHSIAAAMAFVTEHGYVDDESYARDYIYFKKGRKSYRQIREELLRKGISGEILERVLEEEGEQSPEDIRPQLEKYARKFPKLDYKSKQKICAHFGRKGYQMGLIRQMIEELEEERG